MKSFLVIILLFFACCRKNEKKSFSQTPNQNIKYADSIILEINDLVNSEYFDFSEERQYVKKDNEVFILVYEELNNFKGKGIGYSKDILLKPGYLTNKHYQFYFLDKKHVFTKYESYNYQIGDKNKHFDVKIDSIFFKDDNICLWKNENVNRQMLFQKEKEILFIRKEIDSVLRL